MEKATKGKINAGIVIVGLISGILFSIYSLLEMYRGIDNEILGYTIIVGYFLFILTEIIILIKQLFDKKINAYELTMQVIQILFFHFAGLVIFILLLIGIKG